MVLSKVATPLDFAVTEDGDVGEPRSISDVSIPQGAVAPASPEVGNLWFDTANLQLMVYINDGTSLQWVAASQLILSTHYV